MMRILGSIVLLMGLAAGAYLYVSRTSHEEPLWTLTGTSSVRVYEEMKSEKLAQAKKDTDFYNLAVEEGNLVRCESIVSVDEQNRCRSSVSTRQALTQKNITLCDAITQSGALMLCRDSVSFTLANESSDITLCQKIADENIRSQCIDDLGQKALDIRIASGSVDARFCETLGGDMRTKCEARISRTDDADTYNKAITTNSISLCNTIEDSALESKCRDILILARAQTEGNIDLCESITESEKVTFCKQALSKKSEIETYQTIVRGGDISLCETLDTLAYRHQCHDVLTIALVRKNQDTTLCKNLYNTGSIAMCESMIPSR